MPPDTYVALDQMLRDRTRSDVGFGMLAAERPVAVPRTVTLQYEGRYERIKALFGRWLIVLQDALDGKTAPQVLSLLLGDSLPHMGSGFHRRLLTRYVSTPVFFRADDPVPGQACEIQCPGSIWTVGDNLC